MCSLGKLLHIRVPPKKEEDMGTRDLDLKTDMKGIPRIRVKRHLRMTHLMYTRHRQRLLQTSASQRAPGGSTSRR